MPQRPGTGQPGHGANLKKLKDKRKTIESGATQAEKCSNVSKR